MARSTYRRPSTRAATPLQCFNAGVLFIPCSFVARNKAMMVATRTYRLFRPSIRSFLSGSRSLPPIMARQGSSRAPSLLPPRVFPSTGFDLIDRSEKIEEERLPFYNRDDYYPMRIGEVVNKHYQVVAKLGYGTSSTVWLCRDLRYAFPHALRTQSVCHFVLTAV